MSGFCGIVSPGARNRIPSQLLLGAGADAVGAKGDLHIRNAFIGKFGEDKCFSTYRGPDKTLFVCHDGVTLNAKEMKRSFAAPDLGSLLASIAAKDMENFPSLLRGGFAGFVWDESLNIGSLYTNHFGTRFLYYYYAERLGATFFASSLADIAVMLRSAGIEPKLDTTAAYSILSFGYMFDDRTLIEGVRKLEAGCSMAIEPGEKPALHRYFSYDNETIHTDSLGDLIDGFYERMAQAVRQGFEKDLEYGYRHVSLLSGGLDSRMVLFFAKKLGFENILTFTFGQSGCADERIASAISRDLGYDHLFRVLDGGDFLSRTIEDCVEANDGMIIYAGSAHAFSSYRMLDWGKYGLLHNGNLADASQGDYVETDYHVKPSAEEWAYSRRFLPRIEEAVNDALSRFPNHEAFAIATRGSNAIVNGSVSAQGFTETDEPFLYPDLAGWAAGIPPKFKKGEYLFLAMIEKHFPEATRYVWQKWRLKPTLINKRRMESPPFRFVHRGRKALGYFVDGILRRPSRWDMNPLDLWYKNNTDLCGEFQKRRGMIEERLSSRPGLAEDCARLFDEGSFLEKAQVLTLVAAVTRLDL